MVATTGMTFISAISTTRSMSFQLYLKASTIGERGRSLRSPSSAKAGVSSTSRRMM
jgi:hypothetical protein